MWHEAINWGHLKILRARRHYHVTLITLRGFSEIFLSFFCKDRVEMKSQCDSIRTMRVLHILMQRTVQGLEMC